MRATEFTTDEVILILNDYTAHLKSQGYSQKKIDECYTSIFAVAIAESNGVLTENALTGIANKVKDAIVNKIKVVTAQAIRKASNTQAGRIANKTFSFENEKNSLVHRATKINPKFGEAVDKVITGWEHKSHQYHKVKHFIKIVLGGFLAYMVSTGAIPTVVIALMITFAITMIDSLLMKETVIGSLVDAGRAVTLVGLGGAAGAALANALHHIPELHHVGDIMHKVLHIGGDVAGDVVAGAVDTGASALAHTSKHVAGHAARTAASGI